MLRWWPRPTGRGRHQVETVRARPRRAYVLRAIAFPALLFAAASLPPVASASMARLEPTCDRAFQPAADSLAQMTGELGLKSAGLVLRHHGRVVCTVYL